MEKAKVEDYFNALRDLLDRAIEPGDIITFTVTLDAEFGGTYRFTGTGSIDGLQCCRGRFYLAQA